MLTRSSSLIFPLSPLGLCFSISWRIPANRELNSCLAKIGSLWRNTGERKTKKKQWIKCDQSCCFFEFVFGLYSLCLQPDYFLGRTERTVAVLPEPVLEGGWWGYHMRSGCLESLPFCSYDRESPEPLFAVFAQLFLPKVRPTEPLKVRDIQDLKKYIAWRIIKDQNDYFLHVWYLFLSSLSDLLLCII